MRCHRDPGDLESGFLFLTLKNLLRMFLFLLSCTLAASAACTPRSKLEVSYRHRTPLRFHTESRCACSLQLRLGLVLLREVFGRFCCSPRFSLVNFFSFLCLHCVSKLAPFCFGHISFSGLVLASVRPIVPDPSQVSLGAARARLLPSRAPRRALPPSSAGPSVCLFVVARDDDDDPSDGRTRACGVVGR